jgi:hypothetical protein
MPTYRAYLIDQNDRVVPFKAIEAITDEEALKIARQFVDGHDVEVWDLDRKVAVLDARPPLLGKLTDYLPFCRVGFRRIDLITLEAA